MQERQSVSFRRLSWIAALLTAVAAAGAYVAYLELLHYRRHAVDHLPPDTVFAARLDVEQVMLFDPVRRHLLPLVEILPPAPVQPERAGQGGPTRLTRLRAAGLNLGLDLREIVVAVTVDQGWLVVLGGLFPEQGMIAAIERVLHDESVEGWRRVDDRLEFSPSGAVLAQAADGTLILADERGTLMAALPASARYRDLGLAREGPGGAALAAGAASTWAAYPGPPHWLSARRVVANLRLERDLELELEIEAGDAGKASALAALARQWAALDGGNADPARPAAGRIGDPPTGGVDPAGLWARTRSLELDGTTLKLLSSWRTSELDRSARELAAWVRRQLLASERAGS